MLSSNRLKQFNNRHAQIFKILILSIDIYNSPRIHSLNSLYNKVSRYLLLDSVKLIPIYLSYLLQEECLLQVEYILYKSFRRNIHTIYNLASYIGIEGACLTNNLIVYFLVEIKVIINNYNIRILTQYIDITLTQLLTNIYRYQRLYTYLYILSKAKLLYIYYLIAIYNTKPVQYRQYPILYPKALEIQA